MMYSPPICAGYLVETVEPAPVGRSDIKIDKREYGVKTFPIVGIGASADGCPRRDESGRKWPG
jgi:hypothetical protein